MAEPTNEPDDIRTITIKLPEWMLDELTAKAKERGDISVTELIRRAVSLERMLFEEPDSVVTMANERLGTETRIRLLPPE